jgi:predicted transcriptional regulator
MNVENVMTPLVESAHPDDTLRDAAEKMKALDLDPLPVTQDGRVVGCVTNDEVNAQARKEGLSAGSTQVREIMTSDVHCVRSDVHIREALEQIGHDPDARAFSRLPVVDGAGKLVGSVAIESLRRRLQQEEPDAGVAAVHGVESISSLVDYDSDRVDYMSDESFPASDPLPPPSTLAPEDDE